MASMNGPPMNSSNGSYHSNRPYHNSHYNQGPGPRWDSSPPHHNNNNGCNGNMRMMGPGGPPFPGPRPPMHYNGNRPPIPPGCFGPGPPAPPRNQGPYPAPPYTMRPFSPEHNMAGPHSHLGGNYMMNRNNGPPPPPPGVSGSYSPMPPRKRLN